MLLPKRVAGEAQRFRRLLDDPPGAQAAQLRTLLAQNAGCEYGRRHGFDTIGDADAYRRRVPVVTYDELRPAIERMAAGEAGVLGTAAVLAFEETGGTSGGPKLVPYTAAALQSFRRALRPWLDDLFCGHPALAQGTAYWPISPACRPPARTAGGVPVGLAGEAAYFGEALAPALVQWLCVPPQVGEERDIERWRRRTLLHLLADERLALISVWSPTFLLELLRHAREHAAELAAAIQRGEAGAPQPGRARRVRAALEDEADFASLWPKLALISCWDQASSRPYAEELRGLFPTAPVQGKGLLATEGVTSIPLAGFSYPVLALESGFYEFRDAGGRMRLAHELADGREYELIMSNACGLYRYANGDRVRCRGHAAATPMLEFVGRGGRVSDLCGEKLVEPFALDALRAAGVRFGVLAPQTAPRPGYVLVLDAAEVAAERAQALAAIVDERLAVNPQYAHARRLCQLAPLQAARCEQPLESWIEAGVRRGQRLSDIKPPALHFQGDWRSTYRPAT